MANDLESQSGLRVQPTIAIGLLLYAGYLAIFYATWAINDVDYDTIGNTVESTKLHYAYPTLFGSAFLVVALTGLGWWRITLFDTDRRSGPAWAWIGPIAMVLVAAGSFAATNWDQVTGQLVVWSVLGAIGVGFGEEMITRGSLLVGLRTEFAEGRVWLWSTIAFSALHAPNALFGQSALETLQQLVFTFVLGSFLYAMRRLSATLLLPMFLHGMWDSSIFLPGATDADSFAGAILVYPLWIVVAVAVIRRNRGLRLG